MHPEPKVKTVMPGAKAKANLKKSKMVATNEDANIAMYYSYTGTDSSWYSPTLQSDGYGYTSYDYSYRNSYSYQSSSGDVVQWDYSISDWNNTTPSYYHSGYYTYTGVDSTWYSPSLQSDGYNTNTSYDYSYRNSYSYNSNTGDVNKWDYSKSDWNTTASSSDSTWYSPSLYSDGYGTNTSYDWSYGNSYSYNTGTGDVSKWDYASADWNTTSSAYSGYYTYTGTDSTWYSPSLSSDGYSTNTSYDYSYRNSYSYNSNTGDVAKWQYTYNAWNTTTYSYYKDASTWYSPTLHSDGSGYSSYDYTYGNSYSYDTSYSKVNQWDYAKGGWNATTGVLLAAEGQIEKTANLNLATIPERKNPMLNLAASQPVSFESASSSSALLVSGLVLASVSVASIAYSKVQRRKDGFMSANSNSVTSVLVEA